MIRLLIEADFHSGNKLGLAHPRHWPEDDQAVKRVSSAMWEWRCERVKQIGKVDIHVVGGDLVDGPGKKGTLDLLTTNTETQAKWAIEAVEVVKADHRFFTYGTPFHVTSTWEAENAVAEAFGEIPRDETSLGPFHGVRILDRHVLGRSDIPYGQGTALLREWVREQLQSIMEGFSAAEVHTRHHVHYYMHIENARGHAIACPCWELPHAGDRGGSYPRTLRTQYYDVGFLLLEIDRSGEIFVRPQIMPLKVLGRRRYVKPAIKENTT